jgi:hypothetical protein
MAVCSSCWEGYERKCLLAYLKRKAIDVFRKV